MRSFSFAPLSTPRSAMFHSVFSADYSAHQPLVRLARIRSEVWRVVCALGLVLLVQWNGTALIWAIMYQYLSPERYLVLAEDYITIVLPQSALLALYCFGFAWVGIVLAVAVFHRRSLASLTGPLPVALQDGAAVLKRLALVVPVLALLGIIYASDPVIPGLRVGLWLTYLLPALVGILVQTSAEELVFRGYLQQQIAARVDHPVVWICGPALLFALLHYNPSGYGENAWLIVAWAFAFGVLAADLTARSGTLGPAIALHFCVNLGSMLFVAPQGALFGLALYHHDFHTLDAQAVRAQMPIEFIGLVILWISARLALRR